LRLKVPLVRLLRRLTIILPHFQALRPIQRRRKIGAACLRRAHLSGVDLHCLLGLLGLRVWARPSGTCNITDCRRREVFGATNDAGRLQGLTWSRLLVELTQN